MPRSRPWRRLPETEVDIFHPVTGYVVTHRVYTTVILVETKKIARLHSQDMAEQHPVDAGMGDDRDLFIFFDCN